MEDKTIILTVSANLLLSACSDYLDCKPHTQPNNEDFSKTRENVESCINNLYTSSPAPTQYGVDARREEVNSDNILSERYDIRLSGENNQLSGFDDRNEDYKSSRMVDYSFYYYAVSGVDETDGVLSPREEAYFFRTYRHSCLLTHFGNIPIMDDLWDDSATLSGLQIPTTGYADAARLILNNLEATAGLIPEAHANLHSRNRYNGLRANRETVMILAMQAALYEGSWEKYHKGADFAAEDNSEEFFKEAMNWGGQYLSPAGLALHMTTANPKATDIGDAFPELFSPNDLSNIGEVTFWKKYLIADGVFDTITQQLSDGVTDNVKPSGLPKSLVDNFPNVDDTPADPIDEKYKNFNEALKDRDGRLLTMVMYTGCRFRSNSLVSVRVHGETGTEEGQKEKNEDISSPRSSGDGIYKNVTRFHTRLGIDMIYVTGSHETAHTMFCYAEGLLRHVEVAAELGLYNDDVVEETLKPLRQRAGTAYVIPATDPHFPFQGLPPVVQEVRRERRLELFLQGFRLDDLVCWRVAGTLKGVEGRGRGAHLGKGGVLYLSFSPISRGEGPNRVPTDNEGWMDLLKEYLPEGYKFNEDRDYLSPMPPGEIQVDYELDQSPRWPTE